MTIKNLIHEDFLQYRKCSMFIGTVTCSFKCCIEAGCDICQNSSLANAPSLNIKDEYIVEAYINNPLTSAIVFGGLEPMDQFTELIQLIKEFRKHTEDDIVIYTGCTREEIDGKVNWLADNFTNIIIKFGRFIPNSNKKYDDVLGIWLASDNQYAEKIC